MKKNLKYLIFIVNVILAILTTIFSVFFYTYYTKFNALNKTIEDNQNVQYGGHEVWFLSQTINEPTKEMDEIYVSKKSHKTIGDLIDNINIKAPLFGYADSSMGKFITSVNGHQALYENGSWWQILSLTPEQKTNFDQMKNDDDLDSFVKDWTIPVGVDLLPLVSDMIIIFYEKLA